MLVKVLVVTVSWPLLLIAPPETPLGDGDELPEKVVALTIAGVESGRKTRGHRFYGNEPFAVSNAAESNEAEPCRTASAASKCCIARA